MSITAITSQKGPLKESTFTMYEMDVSRSATERRHKSW